MASPGSRISPLRRRRCMKGNESEHCLIFTFHCRPLGEWFLLAADVSRRPLLPEHNSAWSCSGCSPKNCAETDENRRMKAAPTASLVPPRCLPPETLILGSDEVHVWRATLDQTTSQMESFRHTLAADEQARAERFYFRRDREHLSIISPMAVRVGQWRYPNLSCPKLLPPPVKDR